MRLGKRGGHLDAVDEVGAAALEVIPHAQRVDAVGRNGDAEAGIQATHAAAVVIGAEIGAGVRWRDVDDGIQGRTEGLREALAFEAPAPSSSVSRKKSTSPGWPMTPLRRRPRPAAPRWPRPSCRWVPPRGNCRRSRGGRRCRKGPKRLRPGEQLRSRRGVRSAARPPRRRRPSPRRS